MNASARSAAVLIDMARNIADRLPCTLAGLDAGLIDRDRARAISNATLHLPADKAAVADKILAGAAQEMRLADLYQKAARLEARLDPEGVKARKEEAKRTQRVELRREDSGAASLAGRELDPAEAMTGKASIDAEAVRLRNAGLPGTLGQLRAMILMDRIHQRSPWDRLAPPPPEPAPDGDGEPGDDHGSGYSACGCGTGCAGTCGGSPGTPGDADAGHPDADDDDEAGDTGDADEDEEDEGRPGGGTPPGSPSDRTARKTPMPALINVIVPAGTLLGTSDAHRTGRRGHRARLCPRISSLDSVPGQPRRTRGTCPRAERHPRADRRGNLRPRPPRGPLHPEPETEAPHPRPHGPVLRPRLRRPGHHWRDRPHRPVPRRSQLRVQPQPSMHPAPPRQARTRLETRTARTRRHALDDALRTHLHDPSHPVRVITTGLADEALVPGGGVRPGRRRPGTRRT
jgi:Domain of unknown function (DUF222)